MSLLNNLNAPQQQAVLHVDGPIQVLSCAGSGKTRVVTRRIANLILNEGVDPATILAVTFTKKAATEMQERMAEWVSVQDAEDVFIGTFHSACYKILRNEVNWFDPHMDGFKIIEGYQQFRLIQDALKVTNALRSPSEMLGWIGWNKNSLIDVERARSDSGPDDRISIDTWEMYEAEKRKLRLYDFDDLLLETHRLFDDNEHIRAAYSGVLCYYLVDEFQDTNHTQFEILRLLTSDNSNIMVVADDDQSIYSWRGAIPKYTIEFTKYYKDALVIRMETNYRSDKRIVSQANELIHKNVNRLPKGSVADSSNDGEIVVWDSENELFEARAVGDEIQELRDCQGITDIAVLYRTNAQSRSMEDDLVRRGIPYVIIGSMGFYHRKEIKDILAYLRVIEYDDDEAFKRIMNVPSRYLGKVFLSELEQIAESNGCCLYKALMVGYFSKPYMKRNGLELASLIRRLKQRNEQYSPSELVRMVRDMTGYDSYISDNSIESDADNSRVANLDELAEAAKQFSTLREFLEYTEKMGAKATSDTDTEGKVQLLSLHRAKGLEWDTVAIIGVSQGILPHRRAENYEEERRLFYVGMTRAKRRLLVSALKSYMGKSVPRSEFVAEAGLGDDVIVGIGENNKVLSATEGE